MSRLAAASKLVVLAWTLGPPGQQIAAADDAATAKQIEKWILDLDHDRFRVREAASANLFKTGRPAIEALRKAARSTSLELTSRAIRVLERLMASADRPTSDDAKKALTILSTSDHALAADMAPSALLAPIMKVVDQLQHGGAMVDFEGDRAVAVRLDGAKDLPSLLPLLHQLPNLSNVSVSNPKMDDAGMKLLTGLPQLADLNLYGSSVATTA